MKIPLYSNQHPLTLMFGIAAPKGTLIGVDVSDSSMPNTHYSRTVGEMVLNRQKFYTRMPITPVKGIIDVYNAKYKKGDKRRDSGFEIVMKKQLPLVTNMKLIDSTDPDIMNFVEFAEQFAKRAAVLSAGKHTSDDKGGSFYTSDNGEFLIQYVDEIIDWCPTRENPETGEEEENPRYGKPVRTSMRINSATGRIQVSKAYMVSYTIPERIAVLLHEFSHFYRNHDQHNEYEADMNAILIYSGLGYSKREGANGFWKVFMRTQSDLNVDRMNQIMKLLEKCDQYNFEDYKMAA